MSRWLVVAAPMILSGCSALGAGEITVDAVNESDEPMIIEVVEGVGPDAVAYSTEHVVGPGEERSVELAVPGGSWVVTVNGGHLLGDVDAGLRRGRLPVTLILSPDGRPNWQAPQGWAEVGQ